MLQKTKLEAYDDSGGAIISLDSSVARFELGMRAFNQSDANAVFRGRVATPSVPADLLAYVAALSKTRIAAIRRAPGAYSAPDDTVFTRAKSLRDGHLAVVLGIVPDKDVWDARFDRDWIAAGASNKSDVIALPAIAGATAMNTDRRLTLGRHALKTLPNPRLHVAPTVRLDEPEFLPTMKYFIDAEEELVVIEAHGLARAGGNLLALHEVLGSTDHPPYLVASNVPLRSTRWDASGTLLMSRFGIQATVPKVPPPMKPPRSTPTRLNGARWFVQSEGGYVEAQNLSGDWASGCTCPDATGHLAADSPEDIAPVRRRHDTWAHVDERVRLADAVRRGEFGSMYQTIRPRLNRALHEISF